MDPVHHDSGPVLEFEFEKALQNDYKDERARQPPSLPSVPANIGQQPRNFVKNYKKTVCAFWIKGMCMKGENCGFLHEMIPERMPECATFLKKGFCPDPDCPFKHTRENIKECNMYALGFCIFGPECRYNHTRKPGPPPDPSSVEAAKPKMFRDINRVVNAVNEDVADGGPHKRPRIENPKPLPLSQFPASRAPRPGGQPSGGMGRGNVGPPMPPSQSQGAGGIPRPPGGPRGPMMPRPPPGAPPPGRPHMRPMGANVMVGAPGGSMHMPRPPHQPPPAAGGMVPMSFQGGIGVPAPRPPGGLPQPATGQGYVMGMRPDAGRQQFQTY